MYTQGVLSLSFLPFENERFNGNQTKNALNVYCSDAPPFY